MRRTAFNTPILRHVLYFISKILLFLFGWKAKGPAPDVPKYVMIAAPHTSNWDFFFVLIIACVLKIQIFVMIKKSTTEGPFGGLIKWLGSIPIDRSKSNKLVDQTIQQFNDNEELVMIVPPSGTRSKVTYWKTGFYYMASGANVPISLGYLDYEKKIGGVGPLFYPTGDIDADMIEIKKFYADIKGKYPENQIQS